MYIYVYIYVYGHNVFHRPPPVLSSILYVHVSEMLCTFPSSCARFTSPLIMFVFNCIGATKHVLPIYIYIYTILYTQVTSNNMW